MKLLKWLLGTIIVLVLVVGIGIAAMVHLVDWNDFKDTIQNQVKKQTGRELEIAGDLSPSFFPWAGLSIGQIAVANADGFGDKPFASIAGADVKVNLIPLIKREINVRTIQLKGLNLDLQRSADGTSNWDDDKPFDLNLDFNVASDSMDLNADITGSGEITLDLDGQVYTLTGFNLNTDAKGGTLPNGELQLDFGADVVANLADQVIDVSTMDLGILGIKLSGDVNVSNLDTAPAVTGNLASNEFNPLGLFAKLGIEAPATADDTVLSRASLKMALAATPDSAALNDLTITLDDTKFTGKASLPSLAGSVPPVRFDFNVDAIDLDRYLPPTAEGDAAAETTTESTESENVATAEPSDPNAPIELPTDMMRQLDIDGTFSVGSVKVSNLTTKDIVVPLKAKGGKIALQNMKATLYEGLFDGTVGVDVSGDTPNYGVTLSLAGIQADPLLADLLQKDSFLSGGGEVAADISTGGNTVNAIKAGLNGNFNTAFMDGSINGINIGYQIRRAKAALSGKSLPEEEGQVKTDFSSLSVSGVFKQGVMTSQDLDMRSPLLRLGGAGTVDLPAENVDYTLTTLITGSAQGQGGADLDSLKGVKLEVPIRGTFTELSENFAGVILNGMKDNITGNLKNQAKAAAEAKAAELKAQAQAKADALKAEATAKAEEAKAQAQAAADAKKEELKQQANEAKDAAVDKAKDKLRGLFK